AGLFNAVGARQKLPAFSPYRYHAPSGGLICYGPDELEQYQQAAGYVDRILRGEKPGDLPVQAPTKYITAGSLTLVHRELIITLAARHQLPAVHWKRLYAANGGPTPYS